MKLKNNKGYVAIDASIAVLVLLIIVPTIAGMIYNVNKTNDFIDRKTEAISIAVNTIEAAKGIDSDIVELKEENVQVAIGTSLEEIYGEDFETSEFTLTKNENTYKIVLDIQDYNKINTEAKENKVKIVTATVKFRSGKQEKKIELSTVIS